MSFKSRYRDVVDFFSFGLTEIEEIAIEHGTKEIQSRIFQRRANRLGGAALSLSRSAESKRDAAFKVIDLVQGFCDIADWIVDDRDDVELSRQKGRVKLVHYMLYALSGCKTISRKDLKKIAEGIELPLEFLEGIYSSAQAALNELELGEVVKSEIENVFDFYVLSQEVTRMPEEVRMDQLRSVSKEKNLTDTALAEQFFAWNTPLFAYFLIGADELKAQQLKDLRSVYTALSAVNISLDSMLRVLRDFGHEHCNFLFVYLGNCQGKETGEEGGACDHVLQGVEGVILNCKRKIQEYGRTRTGIVRADEEFHWEVLKLMTEKHYARLIERADIKFETELLHV